MSEKFCLKWNDFHSNIGKTFKSLRYEDDLFDVTLVSDDQNQVAAHKLVLSACSEYFKKIFKNNKHSHPLLCLEGVSTQDLNNILDYIYNGEIQIYQDNLDRFLNVAQRFKLEGLIGDQALKDEEKYQEPTETYDNGNAYDHHENYSIKGKEAMNLSSTNTVKSVKTLERSIISADFNSIDELNQRVEQEIIKDSDGLFKCANCYRTFRRKDNLKEHIETHIEGLSFPCQLCGKDFRSRHSLRQHKFREHKN